MTLSKSRIIFFSNVSLNGIRIAHNPIKYGRVCYEEMNWMDGWNTFRQFIFGFLNNFNLMLDRFTKAHTEDGWVMIEVIINDFYIITMARMSVCMAAKQIVLPSVRLPCRMEWTSSLTTPLMGFKRPVTSAQWGRIEFSMSWRSIAINGRHRYTFAEIN